ncbi:DUF6766 family protein [Microbacterium sp. JZ31]|uniref:DUF6766 family protein n=1 Tax=Microbacterium sp. JZ31 TaxID=1906274 RepID=UPI0019344DFE|nr:DUF6766 family protein [Microbacterium sp. JZ31]
MKPTLKDNALTLLFLGLFLVTVAFQALVGHAQNNDLLVSHDRAPISLGEFVTSSQFLVDVAENWQSEFLQFLLFILATVWLIQRGSPESKKPGDEGRGSDEEQLVGEFARRDSPAWARVRGIRLWLYANSLSLAMGTVFLLSWFAQSLAGLVVANDEAAQHGELPMTWAMYVTGPDFWNRTLQNWQSEFLAVGCMVAFSIYLRQRGSAESKPVGTPNGTSALESE